MIQSNATLTAIHDGGVEADWQSSAASAGAEKWAGRARAYYTEKRERRQTEGGSDNDVVLLRRLILPTEVADQIDEDDVLTFTFNNAEQQARAKIIERRDLGDYEPDLRTTRIELADA